MEIELRLLEEWKANNELLKFYEDLKQKRFAHFLTIQTAFLAFFALLAKDALGTPSVVSFTALTLIAIPPLIISFYFIRVDVRSRAFVDTTNTRLLLIEEANGEETSVSGQPFPDIPTVIRGTFLGETRLQELNPWRKAAQPHPFMRWINAVFGRSHRARQRALPTEYCGVLGLGPDQLPWRVSAVERAR